MDIKEAISGRRSVREYTSQPVDEKTIARLIDAAVLAPSAVNQQPWSFTVVGDQGLIERNSSEAKSYMLASMPIDAHGSLQADAEREFPHLLSRSGADLDCGNIPRSVIAGWLRRT